MTREADIEHESGAYWVCRTRTAYVVFKAGITHSVSDSAYTLSADGRSLAIARCNYLANRKP